MPEKIIIACPEPCQSLYYSPQSEEEERPQRTVRTKGYQYNNAFEKQNRDVFN